MTLLVVSCPNYHSLQNYAVLGVASLGGGPATPKIPNPFFRFFFFLVAFRGGRTTTKGLGWLRPPPYGQYGVAEATPWPKMGWSGHPIFGQGVAGATPRFPPFFKKNFLLFFKKKKLKKKKKTKTKT
jgi:hypothetical protein